MVISLFSCYALKLKFNLFAQEKTENLNLLIGEVTSVPLARTITSIWPFPFGLLLQQQADSTSTSYVPFRSSSPFGMHDISRPRKESGHSPHHSVTFPSPFDHIAKVDTMTMSSHLILKDPLEEPQVCQSLRLKCA